jgi:hypothetical protein
MHLSHGPHTAGDLVVGERLDGGCGLITHVVILDGQVSGCRDGSCAPVSPVRADRGEIREPVRQHSIVVGRGGAHDGLHGRTLVGGGGIRHKLHNNSSSLGRLACGLHGSLLSGVPLTNYSEDLACIIRRHIERLGTRPNGHRHVSRLGSARPAVRLDCGQNLRLIISEGDQLLRL